MRQGFSLVELLVVLTIFAITASSALVSINHWQPTWRLSAATRNLMVDLRYAQQKAVAEQVRHSVFFSQENNFYQIKRLDESPYIILQKTLPSGIIFSTISGFVGAEVVFNVLGGVDAAGAIILQNTSLQTKTLNVRPSGSVKAQ